jgi:hypothetical protein
MIRMNMRVDHVRNCHVLGASEGLVCGKVIFMRIDNSAFA